MIILEKDKEARIAVSDREEFEHTVSALIEAGLKWSIPVSEREWKSYWDDHDIQSVVLVGQGNGLMIIKYSGTNYTPATHTLEEVLGSNINNNYSIF